MGISNEIIIGDINGARELVESLLSTKHYRKLGPEGVFAIVQKARAVNVHPLDALNGGMYYVQGKVEMSSMMMNQLIRQAGHSIEKDEESNDTICMLHGKRVDNGDAWSESFSIEDAKRAGIYRQGTGWVKYPRNMLFARALSNLARMLFPDVIKGCYTEGEIAPQLTTIDEKLSQEQILALKSHLGSNVPLETKLTTFFNVRSIDDLPSEQWDRIIQLTKQDGGKNEAA